MRTLLAAVLLAAFAARGEDSVQPLPPSAFAFDRSKPVALEENGTEQRGDVTVRDVRFKSPAGRGEVNAYLVVPAGKGPFAAVLYVPWLGDKATSNRKEFLEEAVGLARRGVVSLLVDAMWSKPHWYKTRKHATDYADAIAQVKELQCAMDLLLAQPGVDAARVAFVGHDFGAMYGALMGAAQPRAKTYVLIAPTATLHEWFLLDKAKRAPKNLDAYVAQMAPLDPVRYVGRLHASVFFQFAKGDPYVPAEKAQALVDATPEPKLSRVYDKADHALTSQDGVNERFRWLARELGLSAE